MGIKGYITKITSTFNCVEKPKHVNTLCVDMNTILHNICHKSTDKEMFKKFLYKELKKIIKIIRPKDTIALFTDGQAVLAKAKTQKKRRIKYLYDEPKGLSTLHLTSGTPFMSFVDDITLEFLDNYTNNSNKQLQTYYSPSTEQNEGELKLFDWLRKHYVHKQNTVIYGADADLVPLTLNINQLGLYVLNNYNYISIDKLTRSLANHVPTKFGLKGHPIKRDFALMSMLLGNDYLPNICSLGSVWNAYIKLPKNNFLVKKDNTINFVNLKKLLKLIPSSTIPYRPVTELDVKKYFESLLWNHKLYSGKVFPNYMPSQQRIHLKSLIKYMPNNLSFGAYSANTKWIHSDVYLLMLMPLTGKLILPERLQYCMNDDSPIKDLFPNPCLTCIQIKKKLKNLVLPTDEHTTKEKEKLRTIASNVHKEHKNHMETHDDNLNIEKISQVILNS